MKKNYYYLFKFYVIYKYNIRAKPGKYLENGWQNSEKFIKIFYTKVNYISHQKGSKKIYL